MCGIAGIYKFHQQEVRNAEVEKLIKPLHHRGPDGSGIYINCQAGLGHKRLSIIDLSESGSQPMPNENKSIWVICNGEIYNFHNLRNKLIKKGHQFRSGSDSEILVHLYEEYREKPEFFLEEVRGMFAFALWDEKKQRMILGRDRLGIKPLFFHHSKEYVAFASEITSLSSFTDNSLSIDWTSVYEYLLLLTIPSPNTFFKEIKHLDPGSICIIENDKPRYHSYWHLNPAPDNMYKSENEVQEEVESHLKEIINQHMIADVPVGTFLSAGIDSTVVTTLASQNANNSFYTFCATFPDEDVNEGTIAASTARKLGIPFEEFSLKGGFLDELESVINFMDQPIALTSAVSLFQISKLAKEKVKVVLTGDGGDEVFGGYDHRHIPYFIPSQVKWLPESLRMFLGKGALKIMGNHKGKWKNLATSMSKDEALRYFSRLSILPTETAFSLINKDYSKEIDSERYVRKMRKLFKKSQESDSLNKQLFVDLHTSLPDEMLTKADRMTMACSIEGRVPLLDHKLVELSMRIPGGLKRKDNFGKIPLRQIVYKNFGSELAYRKKTGFNSPLSQWLRTEKETKLLFQDYWKKVAQTPLLDKTRTAALKDDFFSGKETSANPLFALIVLGSWLEKNKM
ncbi:MAG: asparagine synthase (glutamine-hydrolyzing) [Cytophagaceae bacterium]|nr:asparagine synthase (glutamine-hydrolyzing) [Cytophagaceae bacterium]